MNVVGYLCWTMGLLSVICAIEAIDYSPRNKIDRHRLYEPSLMEDSIKAKRPFCNAFTGCGKKRSTYSSDNSVIVEDRAGGRFTGENVQIPVPIYRALVRAANRDIGRRTLDPESTPLEDAALVSAPAVADPRIDYSYYGERSGADEEIPIVDGVSSVRDFGVNSPDVSPDRLINPLPRYDSFQQERKIK